jgi:6-pyruvoyltetrahydropterin/6-carboxytetrahydropterin synthase
LQRICLYEDEDLCADLTAEAGLDVASVTRRYSFTAIHDGHRGHTWDLFVTVHGRIDPETGMVTDIVALDRLIKDRVLVPFDGHDLRIVLATPAVTGEYIARAVWDRIAPALPIGSLQLIKLVQTRDLSFEYAG